MCDIDYIVQQVHNLSCTISSVGYQKGQTSHLS